MKILLTGRCGQVGQAITDLSRNWEHELTALSRDELDIRDRSATRRLIEDLRPDWVFNAAAYTAVDQAEEQPDQAWTVNVEGPRNLAQACAGVGAALVHFSTDFVFDGRRQEPYRETDEPAPLSEYGRTKLAGEEAVRATLERHLIIRLSWVFGAHGRNFVKTILRLASERESLRVVDDQRGCPTYTGDVAVALSGIIHGAAVEPMSNWGLYHFSGSPAVSWCQFARAIVERGRKYQAMQVKEVVPIATREYPLPATRPANSVLDCRRFEQCFGYVSPPWTEGLDLTLNTLFDHHVDRESRGFSMGKQGS